MKSGLTFHPPQMEELLSDCQDFIQHISLHFWFTNINSKLLYKKSLVEGRISVVYSICTCWSTVYYELILTNFNKETSSCHVKYWILKCFHRNKGQTICQVNLCQSSHSISFLNYTYWSQNLQNKKKYSTNLHLYQVGVPQQRLFEKIVLHFQSPVSAARSERGRAGV